MTDAFFVGISKPDEVRKDLLSSSKNMVTALINYEKYKELRSEKLNQLEELKKVVDDMVFLNKKLRSHMPKIAKPVEPQPVEHECLIPEKKKKPTKKTAVTKVVKKKKTRLEQLKEDLAKYEDKISTLE